MDLSYWLLITVTFSILLIMWQRAEAKRRQVVRNFVLFVGILALIRYELVGETIVGYFTAGFVSFMYWLLLGRYNPVGSSDDIKVYGMDDMGDAPPSE